MAGIMASMGRIENCRRAVHGGETAGQAMSRLSESNRRPSHYEWSGVTLHEERVAAKCLVSKGLGRLSLVWTWLA